MVGMDIAITGEKELRKRLSRARRDMKNFKPWLKQAALIAIESVQTNFNQGGRPRWVQLAEATVRKRGAGEPLRDKGILAASISSPKTHEAGIFEIDNFSVESGTNLKYARPQHFGTRDGHIPPRPFMFLQEIDETRIETSLVEFLDKALGPA